MILVVCTHAPGETKARLSCDQWLANLLIEKPHIKQRLQKEVVLTWITKANARAPASPTLFFLPGGPGLSSATLRPMEILKRQFNLVFANPPGTGRIWDFDFTELPKRAVYPAVIDSLTSRIQQLNRPVVLVGHSFGGISAADIALQLARAEPESYQRRLKGIVFISAPLSKRSYEEDLDAQILKHGNDSFFKAKSEFFAHPNSESYRNWIIAYDKLIATDRGREKLFSILHADIPSPNSAIYVRKKEWDVVYQGEILSLASAMSRLEIKKLMIVGEEDLLLPTDTAQGLAQETDSQFIVVPGGSHFPFVEDPKFVARKIEEAFKSVEF